MHIYNFIPIIPEIFLLSMSCLILLKGVFAKNGAPRFSFYMAQLTLLFTAMACVHIFYLFGAATLVTMHGLFILDPLSTLLTVLIIIAMMFTFVYSHLYNEDNKIPANEFYVLGLLATLGMIILVSSSNFLTLFLGVELMSLPIYAMTALMRDKTRCIEAAMKYVVMGGVASGMLLYGFSFLFGATHSLNLHTVATMISITPITQQLILTVGLVFVMVGIAFKLGMAPFHFWVPDVYDGAPNSVTLLISAAPKLAAFGLAIRFFVDAAPTLNIQWEHILLVIALLSIVIGNVVAIIQTNIKRMLAYSSIAQLGYMMLGLACGTARGDAAAFFYMIIYALTSLGAFGMIALLSHAGVEANDISDFSGLSERSPWLAFMMLIMMFSLAGIPPLAGFIAKVGILEALLKAHDVWIAVVAIIFAVVGVYYYIRVVKVMYFENNAAVEMKTPVLSPPTVIAMSFNGLLVIFLGIFPSQLFLLCHSVFA